MEKLDVLDRLVLERDLLKKNYEKLESFLDNNENEEKVGKEQFYLMDRQLDAMSLYLHFLEERIHLLTTEDEEPCDDEEDEEDTEEEKCPCSPKKETIAIIKKYSWKSTPTHNSDLFRMMFDI